MADRTHIVEVDGVGRFVFRRRTLGLQIALEAEAERLTRGPVISQSLNDFSMAVSSLETLTVEGPAKWDLAEVDPLDDQAFADVLKVFGSLRAAEATFRRGAAPVGPVAGDGTQR